MTGQQRSADGSVTVTVGPGGGIRDLRFTVAALDARASVDGTGGGTLRLLGFVHDNIDNRSTGRTS